MKTVLVDIDHTISHSFWRDHLIRDGAPFWDEYHKLSIDDFPIHAVVYLINTLHRSGNYTIVGITARPEKWRGLTMQWLNKHSILIDELLMRPDENYSSAHVLKKELFEESGINAEDVAFFLEDREDVCDIFRDLGILTLKVGAIQ